MKMFDDEQVTAAMRQALKERGEDYVYPRSKDAGGNGDCVNVEKMPDGRWGPSCIVGHALVNLGFQPDQIPIDVGSYDTLLEMGIEVSDRVLDGLDAAQRAQDTGEPWGDAFEKYRQRLNAEVEL